MSAQSVVLRECPVPDWFDRQVVDIPDGLPHDPGLWAREVFDLGGSGPIVGALLGLRQRLVPLIGIPKTTEDPFVVREVVDGEALLATSERHLDFWCGVRTLGRELEVTTAVRLHGWRGRAYFAPVRVLHGAVTRTMMRRAVARVALT